MSVISYFGALAMPIVILFVIIYGVIEKQNVYDIFVSGAKEGASIVVKIFPTLLGLFLAIGALRSSGVLDQIIVVLSPLLNLLKIPVEIMPLAFLRPISGSASIAIATDIMSTYGVDSIVGLITSTIMGSTETTFYTIAVYTSCVGIKKIRFVIRCCTSCRYMPEC